MAAYAPFLRLSHQHLFLGLIKNLCVEPSRLLPGVIHEEKKCFLRARKLKQIFDIYKPTLRQRNN